MHEQFFTINFQMCPVLDQLQAICWKMSNFFLICMHVQIVKWFIQCLWHARNNVCSHKIAKSRYIAFAQNCFYQVVKMWSITGTKNELKSYTHKKCRRGRQNIMRARDQFAPIPDLDKLLHNNQFYKKKLLIISIASNWLWQNLHFHVLIDIDTLSDSQGS